MINMKTFNQHINKEAKTIEEFINSTDTKMRELYNDVDYFPVDFSFSSGNTIFITEVKTRTVKSGYYNDIMLELGKVQRMMLKVAEFKKLAPNKDIRLGFLVKFTDSMYFFDMFNTLNTRLGFNWCPKNTAIDGDNKYVLKEVIYYNLTDAIKIK